MAEANSRSSRRADPTSSASTSRDVKPAGLPSSGTSRIGSKASSSEQGITSKSNEPGTSEGGVAFQYAAVQQMTEHREYIEYQLTVREQPKHSRMCGVGEKADRRPIDPAPIVQLRVITHDYPVKNQPPSSSDSEPIDPPVERRAGHGPAAPSTPGVRNGVPVITSLGDGWEDKAWYLENPYYFMYAMLCHAETDEELHLLTDGKTRYTSGSCVSCLYHLKDIDGSHQGFFVFPDLSIRVEGRYRLKLCLFETIGHAVHHCKSIYSAPFNVYTAKRFPGMEESTRLSKSFADQGLKVRVRKHPRSRRRASKRKGSRSDGSDADTQDQAPPIDAERSPKRSRGPEGLSINAYPGPSFRGPPFGYREELYRGAPGDGFREEMARSPQRPWPPSHRAASGPWREGPLAGSGMPLGHPADDGRGGYLALRLVDSRPPHPSLPRQGYPINRMEEPLPPPSHRYRYADEEAAYRSRMAPPPPQGRMAQPYAPLPPRAMKDEDSYLPLPPHPSQHQAGAASPPPLHPRDVAPVGYRYSPEAEFVAREWSRMAGGYGPAPGARYPPAHPAIYHHDDPRAASAGHPDMRYQRSPITEQHSLPYSRSMPVLRTDSNGPTPERLSPAHLARDRSYAQQHRHYGMEGPPSREAMGAYVANPQPAHLTGSSRAYEREEMVHRMAMARRDSEPMAQSDGGFPYRRPIDAAGIHRRQSPLHLPGPGPDPRDHQRPLLPSLREMHRLPSRRSPGSEPRYTSQYNGQEVGPPMRSVSAAAMRSPRSPASSSGRRTPLYQQRPQSPPPPPQRQYRPY